MKHTVLFPSFPLVRDMWLLIFWIIVDFLNYVQCILPRVTTGVIWICIHAFLFLVLPEIGFSVEVTVVHYYAAVPYSFLIYCFSTSFVTIPFIFLQLYFDRLLQINFKLPFPIKWQWLIGQICLLFIIFAVLFPEDHSFCYYSGQHLNRKRQMKLKNLDQLNMMRRLNLRRRQLDLALR